MWHIKGREKEMQKVVVEHFNDNWKEDAKLVNRYLEDGWTVRSVTPFSQHVSASSDYGEKG